MSNEKKNTIKTFFFFRKVLQNLQHYLMYRAMFYISKLNINYQLHFGENS